MDGSVLRFYPSVDSGRNDSTLAGLVPLDDFDFAAYEGGAAADC